MDVPSARPPAKRSLFKNKSNWGRTDLGTSTPQDSLDLFSRSKHTLARIEDEKANKLEQKRVKRTERRDQEHSEREKKRQRIGLERTPSSDSSPAEPLSLQVEPPPKVAHCSTPLKDHSKLPTPTSPDEEPGPTSPHQTLNTGIFIDLDEDDGHDTQQSVNTAPSPTNHAGTTAAETVASSNCSSAILDEKLEPISETLDAKKPIDNHRVDTGQPSPTCYPPISTPPQQEPRPDPVIKILIWSNLTNTNPLIVQRKLSQRLKEVRLAWCQRQGFDTATTAKVFLTWRNRRVFDPTNCRSLGVSVDEDGEVFIRGQDQPHGPENAHLEMEATTHEAFEADKRAREQKARDALVSHEEKRPPAAEDVPSIHILLKSKGFADDKLIVRPTTTFGKIVRAFRTRRQPPPDQDIFLMFDGERLDENDMIQDVDIGDMDTLDVHVK